MQSEPKPWNWHCHDCLREVAQPLFGSSGVAGVHWPYCPECFGKLDPEAQKAVENERNKPLPY